MSQKELDREATQETATTESRDPMAWFKEKFFGSKIVEARGQSPAGSSIMEPAKLYMTVRRKLDRRPDEMASTTFVNLHIDPSNGSFRLKLIQGDRSIAVDRDQLGNAISAVQGSTWVSLRMGTESFRLNRKELRDAVHRLEALIAKN